MYKVIDIIDALQSLSPTALWYIEGDHTYENLVWTDDQKKPTKKQVEKEIERLQAESDLYKYKQLRKENYPSIEDQLDVLYNQGFDAWKDLIKAIKDEYPKP